MRGISGPLDHHETARHLLAADNAVNAHTRRVHFAAVTTEPVEEVVEQGVKNAGKSTIREIYSKVIQSRITRATGYTVAQAGVLTGGIWLFTRMGNASLGWIGDSSEKVDEFVTNNPVAAAGLGFGMLLGVSALGIVLFRRISGGSS